MKRSYERGVKYFKDEAIFDVRRQGGLLKARCHGSSGGPYRVWAKLDRRGFAGASCSCPVGLGGLSTAANGGATLAA